MNNVLGVMGVYGICLAASVVTVYTAQFLIDPIFEVWKGRTIDRYMDELGEYKPKSGFLREACKNIEIRHKKFYGGMFK